MMGLSNILPGGGDQGGGGAAPATGDAAAPAHQSFGDKLGNYFESKYPIAGGLANMVFGNSQTPAAAAAAPIAPMPSGTQPDYSQMIAQNAQPKQGSGGLATLLKFFA